MADTYVEVLRIAKAQLAQFSFTNAELSTVRAKALVQPPAKAIAAKAKYDDCILLLAAVSPRRTHWCVHGVGWFRAEAEFAALKAQMMRGIDKSRWPLPKTRIRHLPGGESIVV